MPRKPLPPPAPLYLTVAEAAARWGVSVRHVRFLISEGKVSVLRVGRSVRVDIAETEYRMRRAS